MKPEGVRDILLTGPLLLILAAGCGSEMGATPGPGLPSCPATAGVCFFTWSGASSGTLPCTVTATPGTPWLLSFSDSTPLAWPDAVAGFELEAAPVAGSVIREGDLANVTNSGVWVLENEVLGWFMYREDNPATRQGDFVLYIESANDTEVHGHLSALLENAYGAPGTVVQLCATF